MERRCPGSAVGIAAAERADTLPLRATRRREESAPIVAAIRTWAHQQRVLPESSLGKAIAYMLGLWPGLTRFLDDPRIALDNNAPSAGCAASSAGVGAAVARRASAATSSLPTSSP